MSVPAEDLVAESHQNEQLLRQDWPQSWMGPFLIAYSQMRNISAACRIVGISYANVKKRRGSDPEFAEAMLEAQAVATDLLRQIAHRRSTVGEARHTVRRRIKRDSAGNVLEDETVEYDETVIDNRLLERQLVAYAPEFAARVEHTGEGGGPIEHRIYRKPSHERLLGLAQLTRELGAPDVEGVSRRLELPAPPVANGDHPEGEE